MNPDSWLLRRIKQLGVLVMKQTIVRIFVASALALAPAAAFASTTPATPHDHTPVVHDHTPTVHDHSGTPRH